jgi:exonuclease III
MKIVTWNCNLNFAKKYEHIEFMDADICIVQECEKLKEDYFPNAKFFWTGRIENKGLGVLIKNGSASLDPIHNPNLINFLPIRSDNIKILGVWAYNHRAKKFGDDVSGETIQAIEFYKEWLISENLPCVFGGDFNNSVIWDKPNNLNNFQNINSKLEDLGFNSAYHSNTNDGFGSEETHTFFHTKQESKKYHIDYLYLKSLESNLVELGDYDDWIKLSDHVPIMVDLQ